MPKYQVEMRVEAGGRPEDDPSVVKIVEAADGNSAVEAARTKVREDNPELDESKIYFWAPRQIYC